MIHEHDDEAVHDFEEFEELKRKVKKIHKKPVADIERKVSPKLPSDHSTVMGFCNGDQSRYSAMRKLIVKKNVDPLYLWKNKRGKGRPSAVFSLSNLEELSKEIDGEIECENLSSNEVTASSAVEEFGIAGLAIFYALVKAFGVKSEGRVKLDKKNSYAVYSREKIETMVGIVESGKQLISEM